MSTIQKRITLVHSGCQVAGYVNDKLVLFPTRDNYDTIDSTVKTQFPSYRIERRYIPDELPFYPRLADYQKADFQQ